MNIICNVRTLSAPLTGVQRYTREVLKRLPGATNTIQPPNWLSRSAGHFWEQGILPMRLGGKLLWSPAGTGPIAYSNQVVTVHDIGPLDWPEGYSRAFRYWYRFLWQKLLRRARALITVSNFTKARLVLEFNIAPEKVFVTHLGVDHSAFFPQPPDKIEDLRRRLELPEKFVLFVGAVSARKNMPRLINAWRKASLDDVQLIIAGGTGANHVLAGAVLPNLPRNARAIGKVSEADLPILLTAASAFVYPSLYEGFGLPPLEAMACGTPCLVSNVTSLPEVTAGAALQTDPFDEAAMAQNLIRIVGDFEMRSSLREKGLAQAAKFTWEKTAASTYAVLANCANRNAHREV